MDPQSLYGLLVAHQYALFAALVVGFLVRILKSDTKIPIDVPPRARKIVALSLALLAAVVEKYAANTDWRRALFDGAVAWFCAEWGHYLLIDQARGGKELPIPGLMVPGEKPGPGKPTTIPPDSPPSGPSIMGGTLLALCFILALFAAGCLKAVKAAELVLDKAACVIANQDLPNVEIFAKCAVQPGDIPRYQELLSESRAATNKALEQHKGECK